MNVNFLRSLIGRFCDKVFRPVPGGLLYVLLQAVSREISGECPWDTGYECNKGYDAYWYVRCRNRDCPGYRKSWGLIAYTSQSAKEYGLDDVFDYVSLKFDDWIQVGTLGVKMYFSSVVGVGEVLDVRIGDKWTIECKADGTVGPAVPNSLNKGRYGFVRSGGSFRGKRDTVYTFEIIDFCGYMQDYENAMLQVYLMTARGEWLDFWGDYFGIRRLWSEELGWEDDVSYKDRILREIVRPRGTKSVILEEAQKYFRSSNVDIVEYCQVNGWDGVNEGYDEEGNPSPLRRGLLPYQFYVYPPVWRTPSSKWVKTGSNLMSDTDVWKSKYAYGGWEKLENYPATVLEDADDFLQIGNSSTFSGLKVEIDEAAVGGYFEWSYWDGKYWSNLEITDGTEGFTKSGWVSWIVPSSWKVLDWQGQRQYCIRVRVVTKPSTPPSIDPMKVVFAGQTCRGHYVGSQNYSLLSEVQTSSRNGFVEFYKHQPLGGEEVLSVYSYSTRDRNNCYVYLASSWVRPAWNIELQKIIDRVKTAGTVAIINPR